MVVVVAIILVKQFIMQEKLILKAIEDDISIKEKDIIK